MNRDPQYQPPKRSINGIEHSTVPVRSSVVVPARQETQPQSVRQPRLINDFQQRVTQSATRMVDFDHLTRNEAALEAEIFAIEQRTPGYAPAIATAGGAPLQAVISAPTPSPMPAPTAHHTPQHEPGTPRHSKKISELWVRYGIPILAAILLLIGGIMAVITIRNNVLLQEQVDTYAAGAGDSGEQSVAPAVVPESDVTDPRAPKAIEIPAIDVSTSMTIVGVNSKGNIGAPARIKQASWYKGSDSPLDAGGDAMIVAHVGTDRYPGVFARLHELKTDDIVTLTMGDGQQVQYSVTDAVDVAPEAMDVDQYIGKGTAHDDTLIHLITCSGDYNARTKSYTHRLIVTAQRIEV